MFRQIMRTRFLIGKPDAERRAGHGFVVFPSGWHGQNNIRTFQIGKPRRTTSCAAGPKGISLPRYYGNTRETYSRNTPSTSGFNAFASAFVCDAIAITASNSPCCATVIPLARAAAVCEWMQ